MRKASRTWRRWPHGQRSSLNIDLFDSVGLVFAMMLFGLIGFYLGIDTPPPRSRASRFDILDARLGPKVELVKNVWCCGNIPSTAAALASVYVVVLDEDLPVIWIVVVGCRWLFGVAMQIVTGIAAGTRGNIHENDSMAPEMKVLTVNNMPETPCTKTTTDLRSLNISYREILRVVRFSRFATLSALS